MGSGGGQWVPMCQFTTPSPGAALHQEPHQVQSNLASPSPRLALALEDKPGGLLNLGLWQQSNLQLRAGRPPGKAREPITQQSNLCFRGITSPRLWNSCQLLGHSSPSPKQTPQATYVPSPDSRHSGNLASLDVCTWSGPRSWYGLGSQTSKSMGEPLTLEDLAVPAQSHLWTLSLCPDSIHRRLASVQRLGLEAASLGSQTSQEFPSPAQWSPCTSWPSPAPPQPSQPILATWHEGLRESTCLQVGLSDSEAHSKPLSPKATLQTLTHSFLDSEQDGLPTQPLSMGQRCPLVPPYGRRHKEHSSVTRGAGSRETKLRSPAFSSIQPGQEGGKRVPQEQTNREWKSKASSPPVTTAPAWSAWQQIKAQSIPAPDQQAACRKLLSTCFRAWRHLSRRRRRLDKAVALSHRQLLRKGFRALRWALWLRETLLDAAWGHHTKALLARSFLEWRRLALQQKREQFHTQAVSGPSASGGHPSLGRKVVVDTAWGHSCFRAWRRFVQRAAWFRKHVAHHQVPTPRVCLGQWIQMRQLQASDVAKVAHLALCRQKAGNKALGSLDPQATRASDLEVVFQAQWLSQKPGSLWEACRRLALHRALQLWRTRLCQHQQASFFFQDIQQQTLRCILSWWHLSVWSSNSPAGSSETTSTLEPWSSSLEREAWLGPKASHKLEPQAQGLLVKLPPQLEPLDSSSSSTVLGSELPGCAEPMDVEAAVGAMVVCRAVGPEAGLGTDVSSPEALAVLLAE